MKKETKEILASLVLSPRQNFHIKGNKIISYETCVGKIENNQIVSFGKFSRTTTKQLYSLMTLTGLPIKEEKKDVGFWKYEMGITPFKYKDSLSKDLSEFIIKSVYKRKIEMDEAMVEWFAANKVTKRDKEIVFNLLFDAPGATDEFTELVSLKKMEGLV